MGLCRLVALLYFFMFSVEVFCLTAFCKSLVWIQAKSAFVHDVLCKFTVSAFALTTICAVPGKVYIL